MTARNTKKIITTIKEGDNEQDLLAALKGTGVNDARIKVFKYANYPSRPEYIDDVELEVVTSGSLEQFIKEKYGPGSFLARGFADGKWVKDGSRVIHIFGDKKDAEVGAPAKKDDADMWRFMLTMMQQSSHDMMTMIQASNASMMTAISTIVAGTKPADLGGMAQLFQSFQPKSTGLNETLDTFTKIIEITGIGGGGGGGTPEADPMMMLLGTGLDLIKGRALPAATQPAAPAAAQPTGGTTDVANPPQQPQPTNASMQQRIFHERMRFLMQLKNKAALGKDPGEWADYIEDNQDEATCVWLLQMVREHPWSTIQGALVQTDPELANEPYNGWFKQIFDLLIGDDTGGNSDAIRKVNPTT